VGVGEVFVVAGQSNSANHGAEKQVTKTKRVSAFDGTGWQLADDPQPGPTFTAAAVTSRCGRPTGRRYITPGK
jgi:hypothetical protein